RGIISGAINCVQVYATSAGLLTAGGVFDVFSTIPNFPPSLATLRQYALSVSPGDRIFASALCAYVGGASGMTVNVACYDASGAYIS
ncbi:hypothetical protein ABTM70_19890, partial [Acinetobacter baumannii]